ncbi:hypothetical protein EVJ32_04665 [Exiguobacterium sp. SH5S4]|uniref:hypothetical protein n=1 Tax=Exiguobacterium sp. SH5S4 TaxID=2510961 RepID=UPI00103E8F34|nr:hypothetical protein [Exiguobacterium sp. SH5S4]TCI26670.1 hypothetical protein EVJ32_04665 [Exiguobacterium sp. SH5S4]
MYKQIGQYDFARIFFNGDENKADDHIFNKRQQAHKKITLENLQGHLNEADKELKVEFSDEINGFKYEYEEVYGLGRYFNHFYYEYTTNVENHTEKELQAALEKIYNGHYIDDGGSYEEIILIREDLENMIYFTQDGENN